MIDTHLAKKEAVFANIIWENAPLTSPDLVKIAEKELNWKKSTTYTVLKKLCNKGIFKNENAMVSSVISKDDFNYLESERLINQSFEGSLPAFLAAFTSRNKLSENEIAELYKMLDKHSK